MNMDRAYIEPLYLLKPTKNAYKPLKLLMNISRGILYLVFYGVSRKLCELLLFISEKEEPKSNGIFIVRCTYIVDKA